MNFKLFTPPMYRCIACIIIVLGSICGSAQCDNATMFPANSIYVQIGENVLSNTQASGTYNLSYGYEQDALCTFKSSVSSDFITLRKNGLNLVIASGFSPLTITYKASDGMIEMHVNSNAACGTDGGVRSTSVTVNYGIYKGGIGQGYAETLINQGINPSIAIYQGGIGQGFSHIFKEQGVNPPLAIYEGGIGQGYVESIFDQGVNPTLAIYQGGIGQGFSHLFIEQGVNPPLSIYEGAIGQGYVESLLDQGANSLADFYKGGVDDGWYMIDYNHCNAYFVEWTGNEDVKWHNFQNWRCGYRPVINSEVNIPSNATHMPTVFFDEEIRKLTLDSGASIIINSPEYFRLNGQ